MFCFLREKRAGRRGGREDTEFKEAHAGSISAEHGVGLLKRDHLHFSRNPTELALMRGLKSVFDPTGLFNPGKIFA